MVDLYRYLPLLCNKPSKIRDRAVQGAKFSPLERLDHPQKNSIVPVLASRIRHQRADYRKYTLKTLNTQSRLAIALK